MQSRVEGRSQEWLFMDAVTTGMPILLVVIRPEY
jgi:hypothetical protein